MAVDSGIRPDTPRPAPRGGLLSALGQGWLRLRALQPGDGGTGARAMLRVRNALARDAADIHATCVGGYVELRGSVPTRAASMRAVEAAQGTTFAKGVLNFLTVR